MNSTERAEKRPLPHALGERLTSALPRDAFVRMGEMLVVGPNLFAEDMESQGRALVGIAKPGGRPFPTIHFEAVPESDFRARARYLGPDEYRIEMNVGALMLLKVFISELFAQRKAFPTIGNSALEVVDQPTMTGVHNDMETLAIGRSNFHSPKCPERLRAARAYSTAAIRLVLAHEVMHVLHGHLALQAASAPGELEQVDLVAFEFDSDMCAVERLVQQYSLEPGNKPEEWVRELTAGYYIPQMLFDGGLLQSDDQRDYYESSLARRDAMTRMLRSKVIREGLLKNDDFSRLVGVTIVECEAARQAMAGGESARKRTMEFVRLADTPGEPEHMTRAMDGWAGIRDRLVPYAYVNLPKHGR